MSIARLTRRGLAAALAALGLGLAPGLSAESPPTVTLVAYGDSLVHGYGLAPGATLPEQLEEALRAEGWRVEVVNAGNSGDTTASGLARLDWTLSERPDALLLALGANDGLRGLSPAETEANLRAIIERLQQRQVPILLAGMLAPRNLGPDYAAEFDPLYLRLAEDYGLFLTPFMLDGVALVPELNQPDGIHPNAEGVGQVVETLLPGSRALMRRAVEQKTARGS
ncbi:MAG: arylesterase [Rhodospirillales bacterium]